MPMVTVAMTCHVLDLEHSSHYMGAVGSIIWLSCNTSDVVITDHV